MLLSEHVSHDNNNKVYALNMLYKNASKSVVIAVFKQESLANESFTFLSKIVNEFCIVYTECKKIDMKTDLDYINPYNIIQKFREECENTIKECLPFMPVSLIHIILDFVETKVDESIDTINCIFDAKPINFSIEEKFLIDNDSELSSITSTVVDDNSTDSIEHGTLAAIILEKISHALNTGQIKTASLQNFMFKQNDDDKFFANTILFDDSYAYIRPKIIYNYCRPAAHDKRIEKTITRRLVRVLKNNGCVYQNTNDPECDKRNWHIFGVDGIDENLVFLPILKTKIPFAFPGTIPLLQQPIRPGNSPVGGFSSVQS